MCLSKVIWCLLAVLFYSTKVSGFELSVADASVTGYGYEMIMAKLEYLQYRLVEIELTMKEDRETVDQKLSHQETLSEGLLWTIDQKLTVAIDQKLAVAIDQMKLAIGHNLTVLQTQSNKMISQQTACANHEQMRKEIQLLGSKGNWTQSKINRESHATPKPIRSCKQEPSKRSGKYVIHPTENDNPFEGYCDQTSFGGGWLVIQHRFNGFVDFYRNWTEYRNGFGSVDGEFWLGLDRMHRLTSARPHELLVELRDFSGNYSFALYNKFEIGSETEQYSLKNLGLYTGTAGDSLGTEKGAKFSTKDRDNLGNSYATTFKGAWWYINYHSNLNGPFKNALTAASMFWYSYKNNHMGLAYSRMLIREI